MFEQVIKRFVRWWLAELSSLWPRSWREGNASSGPRLGLDIDPAALTVRYSDGRAEQTLARIARVRDAASGAGIAGSPGQISVSPGGVYGSPSERDELRALTSRIDRTSTPVSVRVAPELTLSRSVKLPAAAAENLAEILGFEMERLTPFRASDVYYRYYVRSEDRQSRQLHVQLALVQRRAVDGALGALEDWDLEPLSNEVGDGAGQREITTGEGALELDFRSAQFKERSWSGVNTLLLGVNAVLLAVAVALPLWSQRGELGELENEFEQAKSGAEVARGLEAEIDRLRGASDFLARHAVERPITVAVLDELSAALPDSTWLFRFEIKNKQVRLQGTSGSASALIGILEESLQFRDANFSSPVVREGSTGKERFNLTASLVARAAQVGDPGLSEAELRSEPPVEPSAGAGSGAGDSQSDGDMALRDEAIRALEADPSELEPELLETSPDDLPPGAELELLEPAGLSPDELEPPELLDPELLELPDLVPDPND